METAETTATKFVLMSNDGYFMKDGTLKEIWQYVKVYINDPRSYVVNEVKDSDIINSTSAFYLIENFTDFLR